MADYNVVILVGRLTRDPELRYLPSGSSVAQLSMAVNRSFKNRDGAWQKVVSYLDIEVWGRQAEMAAEHLKKGSSILVNGELEQQRWTDKTTGQNRSKVKVRAERIQFLDAKGAEVSNAPEGTDEAEDEIPPEPEV
jgi:single-strand DNA-binding protein